ncbi:MAG: hypothetical protein H6P94_534, partial [Thermoplasmatales archaeon]|nr:hypothetical protein [Thermoplasmatales archaeon]
MLAIMIFLISPYLIYTSDPQRLCIFIIMY